MVHDTRYLHAFFAVCTEGGFGRAAARLHRTQPAVTYRIRMLERDLGTPLFERGGRRPVLTPAGRELLAFCRRYFGEYEVLRTRISRNLPVSAEPLRIAAVSGFGRYVLFPALTHPSFAGVRLDLRFRTAAEVLRLVEEGECDLGVVYLTKVSNLLSFRPLREEELVLIAPSDPESPGGSPAKLRDYETLPFVTYLEGDYVFGKWFDAFFGEPPASTTSVHHFDELEEVIAMVGRGRGWSVVPRDSAEEALRRGAVRAVYPTPERRCINQVFAVTRAGAYLRPEGEALLAELSGVRAPRDSEGPAH